MQLVACTHDAHAGAILEILNEAIVNSTSLYDYRPRAPETMAGWFKAKDAGRFPVIGAIDGNQLLGFASYGTFRAWPAYKYTVEHSVYVAAAHRGKGLGKLLLQGIVNAAREQNHHVLIGGIDSQNTVSIRMHKRFGFQHAGTLRQI